MAKFKNRIFGQEVPPDIIRELELLGAGGGYIADSDPTVTNDGLKVDVFASVEPNYKFNLGESAAFARMWTAVDVVTNAGPRGPNGEVIYEKENGELAYIHRRSGEDVVVDDVSGLTEKNHHIKVFSINENRSESYVGNSPNEPIKDDEGGSVQYMKQLTHNPLLKGNAGITSVTSKTEGPIGSLFRVIVEFVVHNKHDFDQIVLPYFLRPGSKVCVDFGRDPLGGALEPLYDPLVFLDGEDTEMATFDEKIYGENGFLARNVGRVQTLMGVVDNYDMNVNAEGSFTCTLEFVSRNHTLIDKDINDDNHLKYVFNNIFDLLLLDVLESYSKNNKQNVINIDELFQKRGIYENLDQEELEKDVLELVRTFKNSSREEGKISRTAIQTGIFHQMLSTEDNKSNADSGVGDKEETYITLGLLEDLFLNTMVSGVIREELKTASFEKEPENDYNIQYDSRLGLMRWNDLLVKLQTCQLIPNEDLMSFMMPTNWADSYNRRVQKMPNQIFYDIPEEESEGVDQLATAEYGDEAEKEEANKKIEEWLDGRSENKGLEALNDWNSSADEDREWTPRDKALYADPRFPNIKTMPTRELFVSTELIKSAFRNKSTVDAAIQHILDTINSDSNNVLNLKIVPVNQSATKLCIHDVNLSAPNQKRLVFDVTSTNSIVSNCNIKFSKDTKLADMIAVQSMNGPQYIDQYVMGTLSHLNALNDTMNSEEFVTIKSLPYQGDMNVDNKVKSLIENDRELLTSAIENATQDASVDTGNVTTDWNSFKAKKELLVKKVEENIEEKTEPEGGEIEYFNPAKTLNSGPNAQFIQSVADRPDEERNVKKTSAPKRQKVKIVQSERSLILDKLRKKLHGESKDGSISPPLPIEIDLTVYGNSYLNIGDSFLINYLPQIYKDRVVFQILSVEHKIEPNNWQTTYQAVMKLDPKYKWIATGSERHKVEVSLPPITNDKIEVITRPKVKEDSDYYNRLDEDMTDDLELEKLEFEDPILDPPPPPPPAKPKPVQNYGVLKPWEDGRIIGTTLRYKVYTQLKFPLIAPEKFEEVTVKTWNHNSTDVKDIDIFSSYKNLAYMYALRHVIFEDILNAKADDQSNKIDNISYDPNIFDDPNYERGDLNGIIQAYSKEEMTTIFNKYQGKELGLIDSIKSVMFQKQFKDNSAEFIEHVEDYEDSNFENKKIIRPVKRFVFMNKDNEEGDLTYYFTLQNASPSGLATKDSISRSIAIPKWVLDESGFNNLEYFVNRLGLVYERFTNILREAVKTKNTVRNTPQNELVVEKVNPGYPFTEANYRKSPFGSNESAFDARQALALKFGFTGYVAYKNTKSFEVRKKDWDNSSELW